MQRNIKRLVILAALSVPGLAQADMGTAEVYAKISSLEKTMTNDATRQNLSKTYGGKLDSYLRQLYADAQTAMDIVNRMPAGHVMPSVNTRLVLIDLTLAAVDTDALNGFSEAARRNLRDAIGDRLGTYGAFENDAEAAMDALDESLGEDTSMDSSPAYKRQDNPARARVFKYRHQAAKNQRRKRVRSGYVSSDRGNQSRKASAYQYDDRSSKKSKPSTRAEKREAEDKRRERALAKSRPAEEVNLAETNVGKKLGSSGYAAKYDGFVEAPVESDEDKKARMDEWKAKIAAKKAAEQ